VSRQLTLKEEEVMNIKKRFKEEKVVLEQDKKRLTGQNEDLKNKLEASENRYYAYKREIDESPISQLRQELNAKSSLIHEMEGKVERANEQRDEAKKQLDKLKRDYVNLKKAQESEKVEVLKK